MAERVKILAFDTSTIACAVGLSISRSDFRSEKTIRQQVASKQQGHLILPLIDEVLAEASMSIKDLDAIAFGRGPGSFTGLRIASSVAQGLGVVHSLPIIPLSSLAILGMTALLSGHVNHVLVAVDARTDQLYLAAYKLDKNNTIVPLLPETLVMVGDSKSFEAFKGHFSQLTGALQNNWCGVGDGWVKYSNVLSGCLEGCHLISVLPELLPEADAMLEIATFQYQRREWVKPVAALPNYLR